MGNSLLTRIPRLLATAMASAFVVHAIEAALVASTTNALLDSLTPSEHARYLLAVVLAFPISALVGVAAATAAAAIRPGLGRPAAAAAPALFVGIEALRHADDARGAMTLVFATIALALCVVLLLAARRREEARRLPTAVHAVVGAALLLGLSFPWWLRTTVSDVAIAAGRDEAYVRPAGLPRPPAVPIRNVLVILVDTLRADHLGCYGYGRATSPAIDRFAREGTLFERAATPQPKTSPAVASLFTGTWPRTHQIHRTSVELPPDRLTIAEVLGAHGVTTFGVAANVNITEVFGFDQGFDEFHGLRRTKAEQKRDDTKDARVVRDTFLPWLEKHASERFFAYLHFIDPHSPYRPPRSYVKMFEGDALDDRLGAPDLPVLDDDYIDGIHRAIYMRSIGTDLDAYVSHYDGEIRYTDDAIRDVLAELDRLDLDESTLVLFTADHGESMTEHYAYFNHGLFPYEEQVHVPLIVRGPGIASGVRRFDPVTLVDVMPTVLELLGVPIPPSVEGRSFAGALATDAPPRTDDPVYFVARGNPKTMARGVRSGDWKLIFNPKGLAIDELIAPANLLLPGRRAPLALSNIRDYELRHELYDLSRDPAEIENRARTDRDVCERLLAELFAFEAAVVPRGVEPRYFSEDDMDETVAEELRQLGYLGR